MSIKLENLGKSYDEFCALKGLSFELEKGEILGFLGPNGAGKSTSMRMITGFLPPSEGNIEILGEKMHEGRLDLKSRIGYLAEHNPLYTNMYVEEYLAFVGEIHGLQKPMTKRINEVIIQCGLKDERKKRIHQLSKGYRQRVGLAQAILHDPEILILDEPASGLDPNQMIEIRQLIKSLGENKTVILSSHIMQEVKAICSRVIIINKGEKVFDEPIENIKEDLEKIFFDLTVKSEQ